MSHVVHRSDFHGLTAHFAIPAAAAPRRGVFRWLYDAVMLSRERQTERDIDRLVNSRNGGFNDSLEREIAERSYSDGWNFRI
jgi:hypothetical protein